MRVIKEGREQAGWAQEFTCTGRGNGNGGCQAVLLVEADDVFRGSTPHYDGSSTSWKAFRCVSCGHFTDVDVPSAIGNRRPKGDERKIYGRPSI